MARYTEPELRERLKAEIVAGGRGGRPGQWSARKAQLLAHEYEKAGGGYTGPKDERQRHLEQWTEEDWRTRDGDADAGAGDRRYLPSAAWDLLTPAEQAATDARKQAGEEQYVANTEAARAAQKVMHLPELRADVARREIAGLSSALELDKAARAERGGKARTTVLDAIERRRRRI